MKVKVVGAPGFEDYEGEIILDDGEWPFVVVLCTEDNEPHVVNRLYVEVI